MPRAQPCALITALAWALSLALAARCGIALAAGPPTVGFVTPTFYANPLVGNVAIVLGRAGDTSSPLTVSFTTLDDTAIAGADYGSTSGTLSWAAGDSQPQSFLVPVAPDAPGNKNFAVTLLSALGANFGSTLSATVHIDANPATATAHSGTDTVQFAATGFVVVPGSNAATITLERSGTASGPLTVTYTTYGGTAVAGADYTPTAGTLSWAPGDWQPQSFVVPVAAAGLGTRSFNVTLLSAAGANFGAPINSVVSTLAATGAGIALAVQGNRLVDGLGNPVQLRGANISGMEYSAVFDNDLPWGFSGQPDFTQLAAWRLNAVRLPQNEAGWLGLSTTTVPGTPVVFNAATYQAALQASVAAANAAGLYVILDLHWSAPGQFTPTGQNPMLDVDNSLAYWTSMAETFKDNPAVIFELFNEPYIFNGSQPSGAFAAATNDIPDPAANAIIRDGGTASAYFGLDTGTYGGTKVEVPYTWQAAGYQTVINAIRATGATNVILLGGNRWDNELTWWTQNPPLDPLNQLGGVLHAYPGAWPYNAVTNTAATDAMLAPIAASYPIVVTELGDEVGSNPAPYAAAMLAWIDLHGYSVTAWTWNDWGGANTLIQDTTLYTPTAGLGQTYHDWAVNHP
jgi:hypothetical protein